MRTINALVTLALTVTPMFVWGHSQKRGQADQLATPAQGWYAQKASDISKENRYTTRQTLENDKATIKAAFPKLRAFYSDKEFGRSDPELLDIMGQAWSDIRRENPNTPLTSDDFVKFAEGFGGLKIRSEPPKAAIRVDEK